MVLSTEHAQLYFIVNSEPRQAPSAGYTGGRVEVAQLCHAGVQLWYSCDIVRISELCHFCDIVRISELCHFCDMVVISELCHFCDIVQISELCHFCDIAGMIIRVVSLLWCCMNITVELLCGVVGISQLRYYVVL